MNSNIKWFQYTMDSAQVLTPIENVEDLRIYGTPEKPYSVVKITLCAQGARLVFSKEHESEEDARNTYADVYAALHLDVHAKPVSFEDWELDVVWNKNNKSLDAPSVSQEKTTATNNKWIGVRCNDQFAVFPASKITMIIRGTEQPSDFVWWTVTVHVDGGRESHKYTWRYIDREDADVLEGLFTSFLNFDDKTYLRVEEGAHRIEVDV